VLHVEFTLSEQSLQAAPSGGVRVAVQVIACDPADGVTAEAASDVVPILVDPNTGTLKATITHCAPPPHTHTHTHTHTQTRTRTRKHAHGPTHTDPHTNTSSKKNKKNHVFVAQRDVQSSAYLVVVAIRV